MAVSNRRKASIFSLTEREGEGIIRSLIQVGRRGYAPRVSTSMAGARLKLGILQMKRQSMDNGVGEARIRNSMGRTTYDYRKQIITNF